MDLSYPIGKFDFQQTVTPRQYPGLIEDIAAAPALFRAAVRGLDDAQLDTPYRPGGWTVRQTVHHVADSHMNSFIRLRLALTENQPAILPYDQAAWGELADSRTAPVELSLQLIENLHARWVLLLKTLERCRFCPLLPASRNRPGPPGHQPGALRLARAAPCGPHHRATPTERLEISLEPNRRPARRISIMAEGPKAVEKPMSSRTKYFVVSTSTCLTVLLLIGSVLGRSASPDDTYKHIGVFSDVVSRIKSEYVEEPDMKSVTLGALNGMLEAIDPFASYLNADQYRDYLKNKDVKRADVGLDPLQEVRLCGGGGHHRRFAGGQGQLHHRRHDREHWRRGHARYAVGLRQHAAAWRERHQRGIERSAHAPPGTGRREVDARQPSLCRPSRAACSPTRSAMSMSTRFPRNW